MKIAIKRSDGGVSIMTVLIPEKRDEAIEKWKQANPGMYVSHRDIDEKDIPKDRKDRDALADNGAALVVDRARQRKD